MDFIDLFFSYGRLILMVIIYIIPIIVGCYLFRHYKEISVGTKVIWFVILLITNYIGLIGLYIYLNTKKNEVRK